METTSIAQPVQNSKLKEFFIDQLQDIYWAEKKLIKKLHKLSDAATSNQLKEALDKHLMQTRVHADRLKKYLAWLEKKQMLQNALPCRALLKKVKIL